MNSILPPTTDTQPTPRVTRHDFRFRSRVHLSCDACGTTTIHCAIEDADLYEAGFHQHVCGGRPIPPEALAFRNMLATMAAGG